MVLSDATPALLGGRPVRPHGPPAWPLSDEDVLQALQEAYRDGSWGQYDGGNVARLEAALRAYHQVEFAAVCSSGTLAVEVALRALRVGTGDEVILAAYDYPGNFLSVHAVGAQPVLVDVDPDNWNLDPRRLASAAGPATKAVIVSHLHGGIVSMRELLTVAGEHGLAVVEDAAQVPGAIIEGRKAGTWGDLGIVSFGGSKLLTAGRGGALLTRRADLHQRARLCLQRGNNNLSPLSELQACVLLPQLARLDERNARRTENVRRLQERLAHRSDFRLFVNNRASDSAAAYYKLGFQVDPQRIGLSRERLTQALRAEGIAFDEGFRALHRGRSPSRFRQVGDLAEADRAHAATLVLHHPVLLGRAADIEEVALAIEKTLTHADRLRDALDTHSDIL